MRVNLSIPERAHKLWTDVQVAAHAEGTTISAWLLDAAEQKIRRGAAPDSAQPGQLAAMIRRIVREELAARVVTASTGPLMDALRAGSVIERHPDGRLTVDGSESDSAALNPEPTQPPEQPSGTQRAAGTRAATNPADCKHKHAVKGWCNECGTGGHL